MTSYEVSLTFEADLYEVSVESDGEAEEVERAIFPEALPEGVLKTIKEKDPKSKVEHAEEVTDEDGDVSFEVTLKEEGKKAFEVALTDEGKVKKGEKNEEGEKDDEK